MSWDESQVQALLDNQIFKDCFKHIEASTVEALRNVGINDTETQQKLIITLQVLAQVEKYFYDCMENDKVLDFNYGKERKGFLSKITGNG